MKNLFCKIGMPAIFLLGGIALSITMSILPLIPLLETFAVILTMGWICALRNRNKKLS